MSCKWTEDGIVKGLGYVFSLSKGRSYLPACTQPCGQWPDGAGVVVGGGGTDPDNFLHIKG